MIDGSVVNAPIPFSSEKVKKRVAEKAPNGADPQEKEANLCKCSGFFPPFSSRTLYIPVTFITLSGN